MAAVRQSKYSSFQSDGCSHRVRGMCDCKSIRRGAPRVLDTVAEHMLAVTSPPMVNTHAQCSGKSQLCLRATHLSAAASLLAALPASLPLRCVM